MRNDSIAIINANIVNEGSIFQGDLLIRGGRILKVESSIHIPEETQVIDAKGKYLLPGLIDDQVHFREPGLTHKGGILSESAAAVAGGVTSFMDMPNVKPPTTTRKLLAEKYAMAAGKAYANYAFYMGASNINIEEIKQLKIGDTCGVKVFMGSSTGNMLVNDSQALEDIFSQCPVLIATHCEDNPTIERNMAEVRQRYPEGDIPVSEHPHIRSVEACYKSSSKAVMLAKKYDSKLHVLHITSKKELDLFSIGNPSNKNVTAEVCVHHLYFDDSYYESMGSKIVCNPAIKTSTDRSALMDGVRTGIIDVIATDHAPHTLEEKAKPYPDHPAGLPLIQHSLLALLDFYLKGELSLEVIVEKTSHALANIYGIKDRGFIREDYWADLVLVDLEKTTEVNAGNILYDCGWSPFEGHEFKSLIDKTFVNGELVYSEGKLTSKPAGLKIEFA
jgi:dihydroorotase